MIFNLLERNYSEESIFPLIFVPILPITVPVPPQSLQGFFRSLPTTPIPLQVEHFIDSDTLFERSPALFMALIVVSLARSLIFRIIISSRLELTTNEKKGFWKYV